jgi:hypothetical protein
MLVERMLSQEVREKVACLPFLLVALVEGMQCSSSRTMERAHIWHSD